MATKFDSTKPDLINQTIPEAFDSARENDVSQDTAVSRDHYPASEKDDALRGTHKLLTFNTVAILTSHPDTKADEYKIYLYKDSTGVSLHTREPNNAVPKMVPGFINGSFIKSINKLVGDKDADFTISQASTGEVTVTGRTNGIELGLSKAVKDEIARIAILASDIATNQQAIQITDQKVSKNESDISSLSSTVASNQNLISNNTDDVRQLKTDVSTNKSNISSLTSESATHLKDITSLDGSITTKKTGQSVDLSVHASASGVTTLQGLSGDINLTSKNSTLVIAKDAQNIDLEVFPANILSGNPDNAAVLGSDQKIFVAKGGGTSGVDSINGIKGAAILTDDTTSGIDVNTNTATRTMTLSLNSTQTSALLTSSQVGNQLTKGSDNKLYVPASITTSLNGMTGDLTADSDSSITITKNAGAKTLTFATDQQNLISTDASNALSLGTDNKLFATGGGTPGTPGVDSVNNLKGAVKIAADTDLGTIKSVTTPIDKTITLSVPDKLTHINHFYYNTLEGDDTTGKGTAYLPFSTFDKTLSFIKAKRATGSKSFSIISQDPINSGLTYTAEAGIQWGDRSDPSGVIDSSNITVPINQAALDRIKAGSLPLYRITNRLVTGDSNEIKIIIGASDTIPSTQQIETAGFISTYIVDPDHTKALITISGTDQLKSPIISRLVVLIEIEEFIEQWRDASKIPPPLITVDCAGFNCSSQDRSFHIDVVLRNNSIIQGEISNSPTTKSPFITLINYAPNVHQYLNVSLTGVFSPGSILYDQKQIDQNIKEFSLIAGGTIAASNLIVPAVAPVNPVSNILIYDEGLNRYKRFNPISGAYEPVDGKSGGGSPSPADVQETYYFSSQGSDDTGRGTPSQPFQTLNTTITYANTRKQNVNFNNFVIISQKGDSSSGARDINGSVLTSMVNGKLFLNLPQTNLSGGSTINARIDNTIVPDQDQMKLIFNAFGDGDCSLTVDIDTVDSAADQKDEMNYTLKLSEMWKSTADSRPTIIFKKGTGTGTFSVVKKINLYVDVDQIIEEAAVSSSPVQCSPIVEVVETGLSNAEFFVYFRNLSQNSAKVLELTQIQPISPIIKTGTVDSTNPVTLKIDLEIADFQSKLFRLPTAQEYDSGKVITDLSSKINDLDAKTITSQELILPSSATASSSMAIDASNIRYKDSSGGDHIVATQDFVTSAIASSSSSKPAAPISGNLALSFFGDILSDPLASSLYLPTIHWNASTDYPDKTVLDNSFKPFDTVQTEFTYRAIDSQNASGEIFARQQYLSEWMGVNSDPNGSSFFGIPHLLLESNSTVQVSVDSTSQKVLLHTLKFTSRKTIDDLKLTYIPGNWIEISLKDKSKYVTGVIAGEIVADSADFTFNLSVHFVFKNATLQQDMFLPRQLASPPQKDIWLSPFPSVNQFETTRHTSSSSVANSDELTVPMHYYLVALEGGSDVLKEAVIILPYSCSFGSLLDKNRENIGQFQFNASKIPKAIIDKFFSVWSDDISIGICPMFLPSYTQSNILRSIIGGTLKMSAANELAFSYVHSSLPSSPLLQNNPTNMIKLIDVPVASKKIAAGYKIGSFCDGVDMTMKISAPIEVSPDLYGFLQGEDEASLYKGSSYYSLASNDGKSETISIKDIQIRSINAVIDDPASKYSTFRNLLYSNKSGLSKITLMINGWIMQNAPYQEIKNKKLKIVGSNPTQKAPDRPSDDTVMKIMFAPTTATNKGIFLKANGSPAGSLQ